jgi:hypothetical protein
VTTGFAGCIPSSSSSSWPNKSIGLCGSSGQVVFWPEFQNLFAELLVLFFPSLIIFYLAGTVLLIQIKLQDAAIFKGLPLYNKEYL